MTPRKRKTQPPQVAVVPQRYDEAVPLDALVPHPANPNVGDMDLLGELLASNGFAGAVLAQESTGMLIDGEHRWRKARDAGMATLPVIWLDIDDDRRDRLLASINEAGRQGHNDEAKLIALLTPFQLTPAGMAGTAFSADKLAQLVRHHAAVTANPDDPDSEWQHMPEFSQGDQTAAYRAVINFPTAADADAFFELIDRPKRRITWWPASDGTKGELLDHRVVAAPESDQ